MDKVLLALGFTALTWVAHKAGWVGKNFEYGEFFAISVGGVVAGILGIVAIRYGAPLLGKTLVYLALRVYKLQLRLMTLALKTLRGSTRIAGKGGQYIGRSARAMNMRFDAVMFLVRRNKSLTAQIDSLKADISELNVELASVVENWTPMGAVNATPPPMPITIQFTPVIDPATMAAFLEAPTPEVTQVAANDTDPRHSTVHGIDLEILENNKTEDRPNVTKTRENYEPSAAQSSLDVFLQS